MNSKKKIKNVVARGKIAESRLDSAKTQNLVKNNPRVSANLESRPLRGAKNRNQGRSSASADFLLEAEKRGSPPKSEKRQLLARRGSEVGGAALLREESSENNGEGIAESVKESQGGLPRRFCESARNDEFLDSSLRKCSAQNDKNSVRVAESSLKIGIVIPIYNVAPYLRECLDSVLNQTYKNFYAVLVNDGSTDNSKEIALEYIAKDSRFTLIDKENGGLSSARNVGIKYFSQNAESALDSANSQNLTKNNPCEAPENSPASWCKKSESKGAEVPPADFLLEAEKRGSPPKSEKRQLLARRGSGEGGAALLRENTSENNSKEIVESTRDSSVASLSQNDKVGLSNLSQKDEFAPQIDYIIFLDSDDFWEKDLLEICVRVAESRADSANSQNPSVIWFGFKPTQQGAKLDPLDAFGFKDITTISPQQWVRRAQQVGIGQFWFSWGGMIDFRFLREKKLQFLEGALYEDELFGLQVFSQSRAICVLPKKLYHYRIRDNSIASSTKKRSLPPFLASLRAHFSDESLAWEYACASSFARILAQSVALFENLSDKTLAEALKRAFLPTLFARSCEILAFKCDLHSAKARVVELLKENGRCLSVLKIIAKIPHKRARYTIFLSYFAPKLVWFRIKKRIKSHFIAESSLDSATPTPLISLDSFSQKGCTPLPAPPTRQKLPLFAFRGRASLSPLLAKNQRSHYCSLLPIFCTTKRASFWVLRTNFSKVFASFCFCKKKNLPTPLDSNSSSDLDSANQAKIAESVLDSAKSGDLRG